MPAISRPDMTEEFLLAIGDPQEALDELRQAKRSGEVLSSEQPRFLEEYLRRWVALHDGQVIASAETLDDLLARVDEVDPASRSHILVRFIDDTQQTLIL